MRLEHGSEGLRFQGPDHPGPRAVVRQLARGVFFPRVCLCPSCGSAATMTVGTVPKTARKRMVCRRCTHPFVAADP